MDLFDKLDWRSTSIRDSARIIIRNYCRQVKVSENFSLITDRVAKILVFQVNVPVRFVPIRQNHVLKANIS